jgi:ABC-type nickel/cobalt efflux system permease component RcnA
MLTPNNRNPMFQYRADPPLQTSPPPNVSRTVRHSKYGDTQRLFFLLFIQQRVSAWQAVTRLTDSVRLGTQLCGSDGLCFILSVHSLFILLSIGLYCLRFSFPSCQCYFQSVSVSQHTHKPHLDFCLQKHPTPALEPTTDAHTHTHTHTHTRTRTHTHAHTHTHTHTHTQTYLPYR